MYRLSILFSHKKCIAKNTITSITRGTMNTKNKNIEMCAFPKANNEHVIDTAIIISLSTSDQGHRKNTPHHNTVHIRLF